LVAAHKNFYGQKTVDLKMDDGATKRSDGLSVPQCFQIKTEFLPRLNTSIRHKLPEYKQAQMGKTY